MRARVRTGAKSDRKDFTYQVGAVARWLGGVVGALLLDTCWLTVTGLQRVWGFVYAIFISVADTLLPLDPSGSTHWLWSTAAREASRRSTGDPDAPLGPDALQRHTRVLKKVPLHAAIVLPPRLNDERQLSRLITWFIAVGVKHVSVFDRHSLLCESDTYYERLVLQERDTFFAANKHRYVLRVSGRHNRKSEAQSRVWVSVDDGDEARPRLEGVRPLDAAQQSSSNQQVRTFDVRILRDRGDERSFVSAARRWCEAVERKDVRSSELTRTALHANLGRIFFNGSDVPDPDFVVDFNHPIMSGLSPWHLRLTEFAARPDIGRLRQWEFLNLLYQFAGSQQRFGR